MHDSLGPRMANVTPARWSILAVDTTCLRPRSSSEPAQPDPVEVLDALGDRVRHDGHLEVELREPVGSLGRAEPPGVALVLEVAEQEARLAREARLHQHLVATHVDDRVDVLDVDRALLHARSAGRAAPEHVGVDHRRHERLAVVRLTGEEAVRGGEEVVAKPHDQELRAEWLVSVPRGALRLAATALRAGREVEHLLPGELADVSDTEDRVLGHVLHVHVGRLVEPAERPWTP